MEKPMNSLYLHLCVYWFPSKTYWFPQFFVCILFTAGWNVRSHSRNPHWARNLKGSLLSIKSPVCSSSNGSPSFPGASAMAAGEISGSLWIVIGDMHWYATYFVGLFFCGLSPQCYRMLTYFGEKNERIIESWNLNVAGKSHPAPQKLWSQYLTSQDYGSFELGTQKLVKIYLRTSLLENLPIFEHHWLVVGAPLWKIWKSIGMISNPILMGKKHWCSKPPTRSIKLRFFTIFPWQVDHEILQPPFQVCRHGGCNLVKLVSHRAWQQRFRAMQSGRIYTSKSGWKSAVWLSTTSLSCEMFPEINYF